MPNQLPQQTEVRKLYFTPEIGRERGGAREDEDEDWDRDSQLERKEWRRQYQEDEEMS